MNVVNCVFVIRVCACIVLFFLEVDGGRCYCMCEVCCFVWLVACACCGWYSWDAVNLCVRAGM